MHIIDNLKGGKATILDPEEDETTPEEYTAAGAFIEEMARALEEKAK